MLLLVFICMLSVVGAVPINATQGDTSPATDNATVTTMLDVQKQDFSRCGGFNARATAIQCRNSRRA
ncbi:hypothetical protein PBY51_006485 [Eleginops maclovinus]|uniref:Uncharacterized protein n=1 Tax=Eleginops maclovinus TaxID=56733 RepID=A0AAN7WVX8_ELEMC|nr:hypothetical protein PBY51_006485 [Eleginops maclovinus]